MGPAGDGSKDSPKSLYRNSKAECGQRTSRQFLQNRIKSKKCDTCLHVRQRDRQTDRGTADTTSTHHRHQCLSAPILPTCPQSRSFPAPHDLS